jgi:5-methyltetrahydrofolate--homocysteine methyltransferase
MPQLDDLDEAIQTGNSDLTVSLTRAALEESLDPKTILDCMVGAMDVIGQRFQCGQAYVPEMLFASRAMKAGVGLLEPVLVAEGITPDLKAIIGTVKGDLHDLGKNLVIMMWKGANIEVIDLGTDVAPARFLKAIAEHQPQLVGLSSLLTTTMPAMKATIHQLQGAGLEGFKTIVGGSPISEQFAHDIGADGYAPDAVSAVSVARSLVAS